MYAARTDPAMVANPEVMVYDESTVQLLTISIGSFNPYLVDLRAGHLVDVGLDHACRLSLADEGRSSSNNSLCTRDVHSLEEEPAELGNNPLKDTIVVHHLGERNEENDGAQGVGEEPMTVEDWRPSCLVRGGNSAEEEGGSVIGLSQEVGSESRDPVEDGESGARSEYKEGQDLLETQSDNDSSPLDCFAIARGQEEDELEAEEAKDTLSSLAVSGVLLEREAAI